MELRSPNSLLVTSLFKILPTSEQDGVAIPDAQFRDYPRPNATDEVLTIPLEGTLDICLDSCTQCSLTDSRPILSTTQMPCGKTQKDILYMSKKTPRHLRSLPPADDDPNIALGMHDAHTHPLLQENRAFSRFMIRLDRILHQKKGE